jgi:hypothetical protein
VPRQVSHCAKAKEVQHSRKPNIISPLLHDVKGDSQSQSVTTFTSCKSKTRHVSGCTNKKEVQQSGKRNIIRPLLHNVKRDGQSQLVTTFTSCKSRNRQKRSST